MMKLSLGMLLAASLCLAVHWALPAAEVPSSTSARLPFFAFQNGLPEPPLQSAVLLKELGYDGLSASGYEVAPLITALKANNLKLYNTYLTLELDAATNVLTEPRRQLVDALQGTDTALWIALIKVTQDGKTILTSAPDGDAVALARLREILAYAEPRGIKIALYPHTGFWLERFEDAVRLTDKLNHPDVGTTFNLCHWLKVEGNRDPLPVLKAALPRLFFVSINGADTGDTRTHDWDRLIQALDRGSYDVGTLIHQLQTLGYTGPVGLQCYNLKGDSRENLTRSMSAWKRMFEGNQTESSAEKTETAITVVTNLAYKAEPSLTDYEVERCKLDLYLPQPTAGFATLVWFHGGALKTGNKEEEFSVRIARCFAQLGIAVAMVNYRLSPKTLHPGYVEDATAAFAWVHRHIAQYGGDSHKVFVGGHSAGGYLTYMIGLDGRFLQRHGLKTSAIAGLIPVGGQTMTHYTLREERGLNKDTIITDEAAPIHHLRKDTPPLLVLHAERDMAARMEENQYLVAALRAAGNDVTVRTPVGAWVRNVGEKGGDGRTVEPMIKQLDQP
jgi:acetyl esterase/lipase